MQYLELALVIGTVVFGLLGFLDALSVGNLTYAAFSGATSSSPSPWSTPTGTLTPWPSSPSPPPAWRLPSTPRRLPPRPWGKSQARSFAELVARAFHAVREVREARPGMAWRHAWRVAGNRLTKSKAILPPGKRPGKGGGR